MRKVREKIKNLLLSPEKVFLILALLFGSMSAFFVPQLSVTDEQMHFLRAYSITELQISSEKCQYPKDLLQKVSESESGQFSTKYTEPISSSRGERSCGSAASYNPVLHAPQALGIAVAKAIYASPDFMVLLGRIANVLFYSFFLYFVIKYARIGKWAIVVIALLPSMVHLAGSLSADTFNNAIVIGFVSFVLSLILQKSKASTKQLVLLACITLALSFTKLPNALLIGLVLLIPSSVLIDTKRLPAIIKRVLPFSLAALLFLLGIFIWSTLSTGVSTPMPDNPLTEKPWHFIRILFNTYIDPFIGYSNIVVEGITDYFSSFRYSLPDFVVFISWITLFYVLLVKEPADSLATKRSALINAIFSTVIIAGLVGGITYALYTAWALQPFRLGPDALYADGVQGRYFTAFLVLLIPIFMYLKKFTYIKASSPAVVSSVVIVSTFFVLTFYTLQTLYFSINF